MDFKVSTFRALHATTLFFWALSNCDVFLMKMMNAASDDDVFFFVVEHVFSVKSIGERKRLTLCKLTVNLDLTPTDLAGTRNSPLRHLVQEACFACYVATSAHNTATLRRAFLVSKLCAPMRN